MARIICLVLFALGTSGLSAQHRSFPLDQGEWILGLSPGGGGGTQIASILDVVFVDPSGKDVVIESALIKAWSSQSGPAWSGDTVSVEYGLSDIWSVGIKSTTPLSLITQAVYNQWNLKLGAWTTIDVARAWFDSRAWGLTWYNVVQLEPLLDNQRDSPEGLINSFSFVSVSWRPIDNSLFSWAIFSDWGFLLSLPNPYIDYSWNSKRSIRRTITAYGNVFAPGATIILAPFTSKLAVMLGTELRLFESWSLVLGWDAPLLFIESDGETSPPPRTESPWMLGALEVKYQF